MSNGARPLHATFANTQYPINLIGEAAEEDLLLLADESNNRQITVNGKDVDFVRPEEEK